MATIDSSVLYTLTNAYSGLSKALSSSINGDTIFIASAISSANQQWHFTPTIYPGTYRLHTVQTGDSRSLDVINDNGTNSINLHFADTADVSGQIWRLDQWTDGSYRLSTAFTGPDLHLDVYADTLGPHLATGDASGQHWTLNRIGNAASSVTSATSLASTSSPSSLSSSPISTSKPNPTMSPLSSLTPTSTGSLVSSISPTATPGAASRIISLPTSGTAAFAIGGFFAYALFLGAMW